MLENKRFANIPQPNSAVERVRGHCQVDGVGRNWIPAAGLTHAAAGTLAMLRHSMNRRLKAAR